MANKDVISKAILVDKVAEAAGTSKKDTKAVIDALFEVVKDSVKADAEIRLIGFGTFKKSHREARKGRNPQTGAEIQIAASDSLAFKSSVKF
ncbi:HU family DNA-binding protein [Mitsuokella sp. oral taxon 131]|uniref:HU family DNA-binding protein n=1 Tax=Mitsuokella sp. oral taxon 131 TaxID=1321780 RepID=UPI0003AE5ECA|nr:putative DNA-binding protein HU-alpha [Mitsuokella sp. oral taxon 131 str. W9106]